MTGNDFENLFRFLRVKLRPAGAQQDSFTPETESEHLAQQGVGMEDHLRITGFAAGPGGNQPGEIMVQGGNHLLVDQMVGGGRRQLLTQDDTVNLSKFISREQQDHVVAGAKDEVADRLAIRRFPGKQVLRRFGLRAKIVADKIGDPLGAGKIQIVFRAKIIGDSGDILPGLGGDIAGGGVLAVLAKLGDSGRDKLIFCLFAFTGHRAR